MILSGSRGSDEQRAVRVGELQEYLGGLSQQFQVPITEISGLIADPALLFRNAGLSAPEIVDVLPNFSNFPGRLAFLTTDNKLYRWSGTEWTASVPAVDVIGQLTDDQLASIAAAKIAGQLTDAQIAAVAAAKVTGQITSTQITDNAITTQKINAGAVTANEIAAGSVVADKIASNAITSVKISAGAVEAAKIAAGAVVADKIATNAITAVKIAAGTITADKIAGNTITGNKIVANTITGGLLATSGIITNSAQINDALITNAKIQNLAVSTLQVQGGAISRNAVASGIHSASASVTIPESGWVTAIATFTNGTGKDGHIWRLYIDGQLVQSEGPKEFTTGAMTSGLFLSSGFRTVSVQCDQTTGDGRCGVTVFALMR
jgi:hypothetical protein